MTSDGPGRDEGSSRVEPIATGFARLLRSRGLAVPVGSVLTFVEALGVVGLHERTPVYWAARATLVRRPEDLAEFDRAFASFFDRVETAGRATDQEVLRITLAVDDDEAGDGEDGGQSDDDPTIALRFSAAEVLRSKDFAAYSESELDEAQRLMAHLRFAGPPRRSLRMRTSTGTTRRPDLRRTVRSSLRTEGETLRRHHLERGEKLRRLVLLLDVSGSMEPYARALLRFVHSAVAGRQRVEAFAIGTRLTRLTRELTIRDPDRALERASARVVDWSGGTRLGDTLRQFNDEWGVRGLARGAIVVVLSDGWDRGQPELLAEQMQRLARVAERIVWVNPLKVTPGYAPLARGMAAALPYVDDFVEGHSVAALEELARAVAAVGTRTREVTR